MNPGRFYMPGYMSMGARGLPIANSMLGFANNAPRSMGLFSKITNGIRSVNWGSLLTNANKTLDVVNQTIPLVRQAGPMFNNMKSMMRIAKAFGSETTSGRRNNSMNNYNINSNSNNRNVSEITSVNNDIIQKKEIQNDSTPNFFV